MTPVICPEARFPHDVCYLSPNQADAEGPTGMSEPDYNDAVRILDALSPGRTVVLTSALDLRPLLRRLQDERPREYYWSVLEAGPAQYRVEVGRRLTHGARAVSEYLGGDNQRLDAILDTVRRLVREGAHQEAAHAFAEFSCGLEWHIDAEETTLFPAFEEKTGIREGPTRVLRDDHRQIRFRLTEIAGALHAGDVAGIERAIAALGSALDEHRLMEDQVVYPLIDQAMNDAEERDELVRRIQVT